MPDPTDSMDRERANDKRAKQLPVSVQGAEGKRTAGREGPRTTPGRRRLLAGGVLSGLLGGLCCIGGAVAVGLGLGGVGFFATLMDRYQLVFIAASLAVMAAWLIRAARVSGGQGRELRRTSRSLARHAVFMGGAYVVTLALTLPLSMLVKR